MTNKYNLLNQKSEVVDSYGNTTTYKYDPFGHEIECKQTLVSTLNGKKHPVITKTYDTVGNLIREKDANGNEKQIALALRDEVLDLEAAGIKVIQIDEPAFREGLPLRHKYWRDYLKEAVLCFRIASSGVQNQTQIHTHMCYSDFNDIIDSIAELDADVITIESSRSDMELLEVFEKFKYPNEIGPGVYDVHSPRVPSVDEIVNLIEKAMFYIPINQLWINPDCGLKTRDWPETENSLKNLVTAANILRRKYAHFS